ncbi:hypothetical protein D3C76_1608420 [compost metagenome]
MCSEYQYFQRGVHCVETGQHLQAIQLGDADVEYDQIGHAFANHLHGVYPVVSFTDDFVTFMF